MFQALTRRLTYFVVPLVLALMLAGSHVKTALAHERVEVGDYVLIVGWQNEPVIVGERNAMLIQVTLDGEPVTGLEVGLDAEVHYAGRELLANLLLGDVPGEYLVEVFPTVRGQYELRLIGNIGDEEVDLFVEPEEVLPAAVLQFPEALPDTRELQSEVEGLQAQLTTAYALAAVGIGLGAIGLILSIVTLRRK